MPESLQLVGVDAVAFGLELLLQQPREGKIHVVAAQQDVVAHRNAPESEIAVLFAHNDQTEVGSAAANIAHQHEIADFDALAPTLALAPEPGVKRGLWFFE